MDIQSYNDVFGTSCNPWDLAKTPGGSSGGGAAAVAAGITPLELGTDVGGSIRIPAAYCGIFGHKSTYNLIPKRVPGRPQKEIAVCGPLARDPEDLRLALECTAGSDMGSVGTAWRLEMPRPTKSCLAEYRIAVWADDAFCRVHDDVREVGLALADALESRGAHVDRSARPSFDLAENLKLYTALTAADAVLAAEKDVGVSLLAYQLGKAKQYEIRTAWSRFFQEYDVLICPSHCTPAFPHDHSERQGRKLQLTVDGKDSSMSYWKALFWAILTNTALLPSTTFPAGLGLRTGLPVGLNVVGPEWSDFITIDVARLLKVELGLGFLSPPAPFGQALASPSSKL